MARCHIVLKNQGAYVPEDYIKKAIAKYPSGWGVAFPEENSDFLTIHRDTSKNQEETAKFIYSLLSSKKLLDTFAVICFDDLSRKETGEKNQQPFEVFNNGKTNYVAAIGGEISHWSDPFGTCTPYRMVVEGDSKNAGLAKVFNNLAKKHDSTELMSLNTAKEEVKANVDDKSCIILGTGGGEFYQYHGPNFPYVEHDWGWASEDLGMFEDEVRGDEGLAITTVEMEKPEEPPIKVYPYPPETSETAKQIEAHGLMKYIDPIAADEELVEEAIREGTAELWTLPGNKQIPSEEVERFWNMAIEFTGGNGHSIPNPKYIEEMEKSELDFEQETGWSVFEIVKWTPPQVLQFIKECPTAAARAFLRLGQEIAVMMPLLDEDRIAAEKRKHPEAFTDIRKESEKKVA